MIKNIKFINPLFENGIDSIKTAIEIYSKQYFNHSEKYAILILFQGIFPFFTLSLQRRGPGRGHAEKSHAISKTWVTKADSEKTQTP